MRGAALLLVLTVAVRLAHADTSVAVVVTGADKIQAQTKDVVEAWFASHALAITNSPLPKDGNSTLINCLVISDMNCARGVVEARAKADNIVGITEQASGKADKRSVQLAAYWIAKNHNVVSLQRTCDACTDAVLASTLVAMLDDLAKLAPTMGGTVHVTSVPPGMPASIDNGPAVTTPFDREVSFGTHVVSIVRDGHVAAQKQIDVTPAASIDVPITVPAEAKPTITIVEHRSRAVPVVLLTVGLAAAATGVVLYRYGGPTGDSYTYRNLRPAGIATGISGGIAIVVGTVWLLRGGKSTSRPEVSINSTEASIGWARSF